MSRIKIERVTMKNYQEYLDMIKWRIHGKRASQLRQEGELEPYTNEDITYGNCLEKEYFWVFAAKIDGEMVGYLQASLIPKPDKRKGTIFVDEVWTQESFRGLGVAKALIERIKEVGMELDIWELRLTVDIDNPAARKVYTGAGMSEKECIFSRMRFRS